MIPDETGCYWCVALLALLGYCLYEPSSVFTAEISELLDAVIFIKSNQHFELN
jgi:hypothetical protein